MSNGSRAINWSGCLWLGALVGAAAVAFLLPLLGVNLDAQHIRVWARQLGAWGPLAIAGLELAQVLFVPISGYAVETAGGYLFGPWRGTLYSMAGVVPGSIIVFWLARRFGRPFIARWMPAGDVARLDELARRGGSLLFFLIWLLPFLPDDLACIAAGLTPMPAAQFAILVTIGRLPGIYTSNWVGAQMGARVNPAILAAGLAAIAVGAVIFWRVSARVQAAAMAVVDRIARPSDSKK